MDLPSWHQVSHQPGALAIQGMACGQVETRKCVCCAMKPTNTAGVDVLARAKSPLGALPSIDARPRLHWLRTGSGLQK